MTNDTADASAPTPTPATPELNRQKKIIDSGDSVAVEDFINWLAEHGYAIMRPCSFREDHGSYYCGSCMSTGFSGPVTDFEALMADHFGIDLNKIETERRALLEWVRNQP